MLEDNIRDLKKERDILLMPHLVLGYPSFDENEKLIDAMVEAGAEIIEMQIPFSEPMADGPVILKANDRALKNGANTTKSLDFAHRICKKHAKTLFVFMTYYNVLFKYGTDRFLEKTSAAGVSGIIIPDLPCEEANEYLTGCEKFGLSPVLVFTPTHTQKRLQEISQYCKGMAYCVGRKGVTGIKTQIDATLDSYIDKYKKATNLPLALGFGIQDKEDIQAIKGKVDIAVIGTKILTIHQEQGISAVRTFLESVRS